MRRLADEYEQQYIEQWNTWLIDLTAISPATVKEAIITYETLSRPEWPYLRILRNIQDHTQWNKPPEILENKDVMDQLNQRANTAVSQQTRGLRFNIDIKKTYGDRVSSVPGVFKKTVDFAVPPTATNAANVDTALAKYISRVDELRQTMQKGEDATPNIDPRMMNEPLEEASKTATALLAPFDEKAKTLLTPLLQNPLRIVSSKLPNAPNTGTYRPGDNKLKLPFKRQ
jgi:type VI secretion system protein ImpL